MATSKNIKSLQVLTDELNDNINQDIKRLLEFVPEHKREDVEFLITMIEQNSKQVGRVNYVIEKYYFNRIFEM